jgi:ribosomal protein S18 acetylase RimI-like enzyme
MEPRIRIATEADLPDVATIHVASWQDAFRGVVPDAILDGLSVERSLEGWRSTFTSFPQNITVANTPAGIQAFCCAGPITGSDKDAPYPFRIFALHVRTDQRQRGFGAALLRDALHRAFDRERLGSAILWTLEALHRSRRFYEREGGVVVKRGTWRVGDDALPEIAYGWRADRYAPALTREPAPR